MRRSLLLALALLALPGLAPSTASAALKLDECVDGSRCGMMKVPLDRSGKVAGSVSLYVAVVKAKRTGGAPILALAGGPGQGATNLVQAFADDFKGVRAKRDVIVFDQRGTGQSGAIDCPGLQKDSNDGAAQAACAKQLGAKLPFYTTPDSVEDIEAVRVALGVDKLALYGVSYGTNVATAYALKYPSRVERLILDSVLAPEGQPIFERETIAAIPRALTAMCRGACSRITSDAGTDFAKVAGAMTRTPLRGPFVDAKGRTKTVSVTARELLDTLRAGDFLAFVRREFPAMLASAARGDTAPFLRVFHRYDGLRDSADPSRDEPTPASEISDGLFAATVCQEAQLPWDRTTPIADRTAVARRRALAMAPSAFAPFDAETVLLGDNIKQCLRWPQTPTAPVLGAGPLPDVPVLLLEGEQDLRTPLESAQGVAARFRQSQVVVVANQGHSVLGSTPCARTAVRTFFAGGAVGQPCRSNPRELPLIALAPPNLGAVTPTPGVAGAVGRTLAAVGLSIQDLAQERANLNDPAGNSAGGGLRGGRFAQRKAGKVGVTGFSYVQGVTLSGSIAYDLRASGSVKVGGSAASAGTLTLKKGVWRGTLGGRSVTLKVKVPKPPEKPIQP